MQTMLAAQMYTVREFMQTPEGIADSLKKVAACGYRAVQMSGWAPIDPKMLRDLADQNDLEICATHLSFEELTNNLDRQIEAHRTYGCKYIGLGSMPRQFLSDPEGLRRFTEIIRPVGQKIADHGLQFIYHNHNFEFARFGQQTGMEILMEATQPEWFQFELDTYWVQAGGGDVVDWISKLRGRMDVVHFKDMVYDPAQKQPIMAEIGEGNLNWLDILRVCGENSIRWHIVEQDICQRDPFESLGISLRNLQRMGLR